MPLIRINATTDGLTLHETPQPLSPRLTAMATSPGPAIIMIHGYKYEPGSADHCPHKKLFGAASYSWPCPLGFSGTRADEGLGIALGWHARGSLRKMHARARNLGKHLADIVSKLRTDAPRRPVHVLAHSLGSEMALSSLAHLPKGAIDRMILLTGASYESHASAMLQTAAGSSAEILNVTSRENDLFDLAFERLVPSRRTADRAIGHGITASNVATLQLDCNQTINNIDALGYRVAPSAKRICHWSTYTRAGALALYSSFLREPDALPLTLVTQACPEVAEPRWVRLLPLPSMVRLSPARDLSLSLRALGSTLHKEKPAA